MSETAERRCNLVFAGQLRPGTDRARAERTLAAFFGLRDPAAVRLFFSGRPVPLRRDLSRDEALRLYRQLRSVGLICDVQPTPPPSVEREAAPQTTGPESRGDGPGGALPVAAPASTSRMARAPSATAGSEPAPAPLSSAPAAPTQPLVRRVVPKGRPPNIFALRAATPVAAEAAIEASRTRAIVLVLVAATLCLLVLVVTLRFAAPAPGAAAPGPLAAAATPGGHLILLLADALLLHERSGLERRRYPADELGLAALAEPLLASADGSLILRGQTHDDGPWQLYRCRIEDPVPVCSILLSVAAPPAPLGLSESYLGDVLFLRLPEGRLLRVSSTGAIEAEAAAPAASGRAPMLYLQGLLLLTEVNAPLLGVFRTDREGFGAQLDALFLMTGDDAAAARRVIDIASTGDDRYALLEDEAEHRQLYHFDRDWGSARRVVLESPPGSGAYLAVWRDRLLLPEATGGVMARVAPGGREEKPFTSSMLNAERNKWQQAMVHHRLSDRLGLVAPLVLTAILLALAGLFFASARALLLRPPLRGALLDPMPGGIHWLPAAEAQARTAALLGRVLIAGSLLPAVALLAVNAPVQAACCLPAILACARARMLLREACGGHLGRRGREVIVVDHDGRYFYGRDGQLSRGLGMLFAGAAVLPIAVPGLGALALTPAASRAAMPPAQHCDALTVIGLLWHLRHPWLRACLQLALGILLSVGAWLLTA